MQVGLIGNKDSLDDNTNTRHYLNHFPIYFPFIRFKLKVFVLFPDHRALTVDICLD